LIRTIKKIVKPFYYRLKNTFFFNPPKRGEDYFLAEQKVYEPYIETGDLVFDIGANIGDKTQVFLNLGARVISCEPQNVCMNYMKNRFGNRYGDQLIFVNKGVGDQEGRLEISICDEANTISTFSDRWKTGRFKSAIWNRVQPVSMTTLDWLIAMYGVPKFCKIDVEGFELKVLKGLSQPVQFLSFEYTNEFLDEGIACISHISTLGKAEYNFDCGGDLILPEWVGPDQVIQKLKEKNAQRFHGNIYSRMA
jgi:FkbM family methyltransferase